MFDADTARAPLATLWGAMTPRARAAPPPPPDVPALVAAAEARGRAAGQGEAEAALAPLRARLAAAAAALDAACAIDAATLAPLFADLVGRIARAVVGGELRQSGDAVERLARAALDLVAGDGPATLFVAAADAEMASEIFPARHPGAGRDEAGVRVAVAVDPALAPGEVRVETPRHVVAASLDARLADIVAGLA